MGARRFRVTGYRVHSHYRRGVGSQDDALRRHELVDGVADALATDTGVADGSRSVYTTRDALDADQYGTIRRCAEELLTVADEEPIYAAVRGRDVVTGDPRTVAGRVVDVILEDGYERATLSIDTDDGRMDVGGRAAALEDVEAHEIRVARTPFADWET